jgi:outer membrane receptor for ferrienterochelin and colicins
MKKCLLVIINIFAMLIFCLIIQVKGMAAGKTDNKIKELKFLSLSGVVKSYDRVPIAGALVLIPEIGKSTETDKTGLFEILAITPGKYHIEVYAEGFMDFQSDILDLTRARTKFNVTLLKKISEEIVVTATRTQKLYVEVPVKTEVITARDVGKMQASQLAESLAFTTGVRVENNCQNCNFTQVRINGMEGKYSQILIDNSPVFSSMIGVYGLEQIPTEMINRIEIVKGGGSALYGGSAVAGVINILTKEPMENTARLTLHQETVSGEPFTNMGFRSSLVSKSGNTKGFLYANYKSREPVDIDGDGYSEIGKLRSTNFGFNLYNYFSGIKGKLKLGFFRVMENRRGGNRFAFQPHEADIAESIDSDINGITADWNHYLTKKLYYNLAFSYVDATRESYYGSGRDLNAYGSTQNPVLFLNSQFNYQAGSHLLSTGIQFRGESLRDKALGYGREIDENYRELGIFLQDDVKLSKMVFLLAGIRISKHSLLDKLIINPRMSVLLNVLKDVSWRTTFSTGYRAPQVFDEDLHITQVGGEGMIIENDPDLKKEQSYSISTGFDFGKQIGGHVIQTSIECFYTMLSDAFVLNEQEFDPRENALVFRRINGSNARVYGVSIDFGYRIKDRFFLRVGPSSEAVWTTRSRTLVQRIFSAHQMPMVICA